MNCLFYDRMSSMSRDDLAIVVQSFPLHLLTSSFRYILNISFASQWSFLLFSLQSLHWPQLALQRRHVLLALIIAPMSWLRTKVIYSLSLICCTRLIEDIIGFTEDDLKEVLKGSDLENEDLKNVLFHCKNPGDVGHPKLCSSGCTNPATEGSHSCSA